MIRSRTVIAVPPGATIKEQLIDRKMSQKEFASRMGMSEKHISKLINGEVMLTPETAIRLEMVLGIPARFWNNLESLYREKLIRVKEENDVDDDIEIAKSLPYSEMAKNGWVEATRNPIEKVINLRKYFEVVSLSMIDGQYMPKIAARKVGESKKSKYALLAWAQRAKIEARSSEVANINIDRLQSLIPEFRSMTRQNPSIFCKDLRSKLSECGVSLVFLPHMEGSYLHGATFMDGSKIVMGLTVRGKDADRFWFSFFHEVSHILLGHLWKNGEITDEDENEANELAKTMLISNEDFKRFAESRQLSRNSIIEFANTEGVDPGIVVGRLQKERYINFSEFNDLKVQYEIAN